MGEFHLERWIIVLAVLVGLSCVWGYPLSVLCRRAGKSPTVGWLAGSIGLLFAGPLWCIWWLALSNWHTTPTQN